MKVERIIRWMSKAEETIEVYGMGEICLLSGPTECTHGGEGHKKRGLKKEGMLLLQ